MIIETSSITQLSDRDLLEHVQRAASSERQATAQLIVLLIELDARRLYLAEGCSSLFTYCRQVLHLSEHAAYGRIEAARAARRFPAILERLAEGALNLTSVSLLAPHLTPQNCVEVLDAARHKSKRDIEQVVARLCPRPDAPTVIRKLPAPRELRITTNSEGSRFLDLLPTPEVKPAPVHASGVRVSSPRPPEVKPLAPERFKIQFTINHETHTKLRRAQDLLRHTIPNGDPAAIFDKALTLLLKELSKVKHAAAERPRATRIARHSSRHIPAGVKRTVWQRDGGQCAFVGRQGRCAETGFLEFHHIVPFAAGGKTSTENLELRCRAHNAYEAEKYFGLSGPPVARETRHAFDCALSTRSGPSSGRELRFSACPLAGVVLLSSSAHPACVRCSMSDKSFCWNEYRVN